MKHSYGDGGTAGPGIAEEEEKDTEVSCAECKPIPEVRPREIPSCPGGDT